MTWNGEERRNNSECSDKEKIGKIAGWQKAQAAFVGLCFTAVFIIVGMTNSAVKDLAATVGTINDKVIYIDTTAGQVNSVQSSFNTRVIEELEYLKKENERMKLSCQRIYNHLGLEPPTLTRVTIKKPKDYIAILNK